MNELKRHSGFHVPKPLFHHYSWFTAVKYLSIVVAFFIAFFMHSLPVRRNMIVTDEVIEAPTSLVIPEAANREISATVVLKRMLEGLE